MTSQHSMDCAMARHAAQHILFADKPARADILELRLPRADATHVAINVWRNHNFETLSALLEPYCLFGRWLPEFNIGAYDDSLMFEGWQRAAAELIWLDSSRISSAAFLPWISQRLQALRAHSQAPILLVTWHDDAAPLQALCERLTEVYWLDLRQLCGAALLSERTSGLTGSPISKPAQLVIARELACRALPALLFPPIKAVALDLDETLHAGVLAEDGVSGVQLTDAHRALQQQLKALRERGVYLALVSRNDARDVELLFAERQEYPLRLQDFSAIEVSWGEKSAALRRIAERLRIAADALLFVDDNAGELAEVAAALPSLHTLHADSRAQLTQRALSFYPGLWRVRAGAADKLRVADLQANTAREELAARVSDPAEYFRSLRVKLSFRVDAFDHDEIERLAALSLKTNQFNLATKRWGAAKLRDYLTLSGASLVSVQLQDRLSDSGVIALVCAHRRDTTLIVDELCISCRALGRRLEHSIVLLALRAMPAFQGCARVAFDVQLAARNQPALRWLETLLVRTEPVGEGTYDIPAANVRDFAAPSGVLVELTTTTE